MHRPTLLLLPLALAGSIAFAAPAQADPEYDRCSEAARSNADFSACGTAMLARREAELNRVWKEAIAGLEPGMKQALIEEQRAWAAYKDKSCRTWTTGHMGREGQVIHFYVCRGDVIDQRITFLEDFGNSGEPESAE
jgi:uncharacterized protein YecT (DUF1311 family)